MNNFRVFKHGETLTLLVVLLLVVIGVVFIYSASYHPEKPDPGFWSRQIIWASIGIFLCLVVWSIDYRHFVTGAYFIFGINILLLICVFIFGSKTSGAQRWLKLGFLKIQPSEFFKISMVLFLAKYYSGLPHYKKGYFNYIIVPFLFIGPAILLIMKQPDLGTALVLVPLAFTMAYVAGANPAHIFYTVLTGAACVIPGYFFLKPYQQDRIKVFLNPEFDPMGVGYQAIQSKIAVGSGGVIGKGWLKGTQTQLNFLPERHTDFIYSVIGEEWGFIGAVLVIILFLLVIYSACRIAAESRDEEGRLIASGLAALFLIHVFINAGMAVGIMPITGLPMPFLSYGGSSLIAMLISIGLLQSIYSRRFMF